MDFVPKIAQKGPYITKEKEDTKRAWCSCGLSQIQPFCDGSHREHNTGMRSVGVQCQKDGEYAWCGCKKTKTPPYCDGSHSQI